MTVYIGMLPEGDRATALPGADLVYHTGEWYFRLRSENERLWEDELMDEALRDLCAKLWSYFVNDGTWNSQQYNNIMHALTSAPDDNRYSIGGAERAVKHYNRLSRFGINPVELEFSSVEEIVRYLGYGAIYDRPGTCLLTHQTLDGVDEDHIIEAPVWVPMLNSSEAPKVTILRSIVDRKSWDCTHMGCGLPKNPHTDPSRYTQANRNESICAITARRFTDDAPWSNANSGEPGFPLIPVHPWVKSEISQILVRYESPRGLDPTEWSPSRLMPHIPSSRIS